MHVFLVGSLTFFGFLFSFARYAALNLEELAFSEKLSRPRKKRKRDRSDSRVT
jgi:hypothetical protein